MLRLSGVRADKVVAAPHGFVHSSGRFSRCVSVASIVIFSFEPDSTGMLDAETSIKLE